MLCNWLALAWLVVPFPLESRPSHGGNRGSNPLGDAKVFKGL